MNTRSFLLATVVAGAVMGLLGNLPFVNLCNCLLCIWVWLSGALAVVMYRRFQHGQPGPSAGQGAGLGAVAGLIGAFLGFFIFLLTSAVSAPIMQELVLTLNIQGNVPSAGLGSGILAAFFWLMFDIVLYPLFGALGGLIAANMGKSPAAPSTPPAPPPAPTPTPPAESPTPPAAS